MRLHLKYHNGSWRNETTTTMDSGLDMDVSTPSRDVTQHSTQDETTEKQAVRQPEIQMRRSKSRLVSRLKNRHEFVTSLNRTMPSFPSESTTPKKGLNTSTKRRENNNNGPAAKKRILTENVLEEKPLTGMPSNKSKEAPEMVNCDLNQTAPVYQQPSAFVSRPPVPFSPSSWYPMYPPSPYMFYGGYPYQQQHMYRSPLMSHLTSSHIHAGAYLQGHPTYVHYHQPSPVRYSSSAVRPFPLQSPSPR